ncbi:MAG: hypothetical protein F6K18_03070 [Okeania sp. SIO2C2]|uniref:hypothetical protein n=1 Tax=Okeania sp. SIO2C2 TaxID=2607787 RepID=UPI0013B5B761|nr:hypothetical protein [Okeania sp. SIO2C2]NEP85882.1 hypothetical protein [Okeania sp. SIO2C2]
MITVNLTDNSITFDTLDSHFHIPPLIGSISDFPTLLKSDIWVDWVPGQSYDVGKFGSQQSHLTPLNLSDQDRGVSDGAEDTFSCVDDVVLQLTANTLKKISLKAWRKFLKWATCYR